MLDIELMQDSCMESINKIQTYSLFSERLVWNGAYANIVYAVQGFVTWGIRGRMKRE